MSLDLEAKNSTLNEGAEEETEGVLPEREEEEAEPESPVSEEDSKELREMTEAGLFFGRKKTKTHPRMKPFILTTRNGVEILDLMKTIEQINKAIGFLKEINVKGGKVLLVGTQPAAREAVMKMANDFSFPYVTNKWVGGVLTNFNVIRKRVDKYIKLKEDKESGRLAKYNKKEMSKINREMDKMNFLFSGVEKMTAAPEAILLINPREHMTAIREAKILGIPTVAILSSDNDPELVDYPIVANDNAEKSIGFVLEKIGEGIKKV